MTTRRQLIQAAAAGVLSVSARGFTQSPASAQTGNRDRLLAIPGPGRVRVVLDTDTYNELDDQYALAYMLLSPERMSVEAIWDISAVAWMNNPEWVPSQIVPSPVLTDDMHWQSAAGRHNIRVANNVDRDAIFNDVFSRLSHLDDQPR